MSQLTPLKRSLSTTSIDQECDRRHKRRMIACSSKSTTNVLYTESTPLFLARQNRSIIPNLDQISPIQIDRNRVEEQVDNREQQYSRSIFFEPFEYDRISVYKKIGDNVDFSRLGCYTRDQIPFSSQTVERNYQATLSYGRTVFTQQESIIGPATDYYQTQIADLLYKLAVMIKRCESK